MKDRETCHSSSLFPRSVAAIQHSPHEWIMTSFKDARILPYEELPAIVTSSYLRFLITGLGQKEKKKKRTKEQTVRRSNVILVKAPLTNIPIESIRAGSRPLVNELKWKFVYIQLAFDGSSSLFLIVRSSLSLSLFPSKGRWLFRFGTIVRRLWPFSTRVSVEFTAASQWKFRVEVNLCGLLRRLWKSWKVRK